MKIKDSVLKEIIPLLDRLNENSGEMELNGKEYVVIPVDSELSGFVEKAVDMTIEKMKETIIKEIGEIYYDYNSGYLQLSLDKLKEILTELK